MPTMPSVAVWSARGRVLFPGLLACGVVAAAASFLSQHYGAPEMLFALLLGMAMNFLATEGPCAPGGDRRDRHEDAVWRQRRSGRTEDAGRATRRTYTVAGHAHGIGARTDDGTPGRRAHAGGHAPSRHPIGAAVAQRHWASNIDEFIAWARGRSVPTAARGRVRCFNFRNCRNRPVCQGYLPLRLSVRVKPKWRLCHRENALSAENPSRSATSVRLALLPSR